MTALELANSLGKVTRTADGLMACCPAHDDKNPSLSVKDSEDGKILVKCFAGCSQDAVISALKAQGLWKSEVPPAKLHQKVTGKYEYYDRDGNLIYWKKRLEPGRGGRSKEFIFEHGERQTGRGGDPIPYRLNELAAAKSLIIVEGEKQADLLISWGLASTTLDSGAASPWRDEYLLYFEGKRIAILPDNDTPGRGYADRIAKALHGHVASLKVVELPGLPEKGDICDWTQDSGNGKARLLELIKAAPEWEPVAMVEPALTEENPPDDEPEVLQESPRIHVVNILDFMAREFPPRENLLAPWLPVQGLTMIYAPRGIGKTHFSLGVSYAVASGGEFLGWQAPRAASVLFLDGEMPAVTLQERIARINLSSPKEPAAPFRIITPDLQNPATGMIDLSRPADQRELEKFLEGVELIVVDNLSTLCRSGKESEGEGWLPVQDWTLRQRAAGRSVLLVHHSGKNGEQRGTSRREDVLDTVIALKRPADYSPDKGATFEVHFEKSRGIYGEDTKPFEAQLSTNPISGLQEWTVKSLDKSTAEKVAALLDDGLSQIEIAEMLKMTRGAISKAAKKASELGLLKGCIRNVS